MNSTVNTLSNAMGSVTGSPPLRKSASGITTTTQAIYSIISTIAILGNTLTILVFVLDKKLLKKSYNVFILFLAIADVLTAINLITNPAFVLGDAFPYPTDPILGDIFCRVIWSRVFIFQLVVFSVYITLLLTAERWVAVVKPSKYNDAFNRERVIRYVILSWVWSLVITGTALFEIAYKPNSSSNQICEFKFFAKGSFLRVSVSIFQITMKMFFPCLLMIALYIHMIVRTNNSPVASAESKAKLRGNMTRMIGVASIILIICFAPNQIYLVFAIAGKTKLDTTFHHSVALLTFITTCTNPFIYGLSNQNYRRRYKKILFAMCPKLLGEEANVVNVDVVMRARRVQPAIQESPHAAVVMEQ